MTGRSVNSMPPQKISEREKNEQWRKDNVDFIIGSGEVSFSDTDQSYKREMQINYDLYNGIYDEKDIMYVLNPFKQKDGFPAEARNFNIIKPKIDLMLGEETKRPFNFVVTRTSEKASSELMEKKKEMIMQYLMAAFEAQMSPEAAAEFQQKLQTGEVQLPENIQEYMKRTYKDISESAAYHSLIALRKKLNIDHEFSRSFKDLLIAGVNPMYVGIQNGIPVLRRVNPKHFTWEYSPDLEFIDEANWCCEHLRMSYTEVYDQLYDKLEEKDLNNMIEFMHGSRSASHGIDKNSKDDFVSMNYRVYNNLNDLNNSDSSTVLDVYHVCWKSFRKIGFVVALNIETGQPEEFMVDEFYVKTGQEISIEWSWVVDVWEGYRIGKDIYAGIQPIEHQYLSEENPNSQKLPYTGVVYSNTNSVPKSLVSTMKSLQYMYIIIWYRLELAMAKDKGKIFTMDITQIPRSQDLDFNRWAHMLTSLGINLINPYESNADLGIQRDGSHPATFNQISAQDLTMANTIGQYIDLMAKIEEMIDTVTGITKQRQGSVAPNELVGNAQLATLQSTYITEPIFWSASQVKKRALQMLLNAVKSLWASQDKQYVHYITDDGERVLFQIEESSYEDMDIYVSDSTEDLLIIQQIQSLYQPAMQNGTTLGDIAEIMTTKNVNMIKEKLRNIEEKRQAQMQAQQDQEAQLQQQAMQTQKEIEDTKAALAQAQLELSKYKTDTDNQTKIVVAEIGAFRFQEDLDANNNGIPDPIEIANFQLASFEANAKDKQEVAKADLKKKEIDTKKEIEHSKINLEKEKLRAAKELQRIKDSAAMEREQLKARTALKNKVAGERRK